jgi:SagB-type dehydrogenase family enzyme
MPDIIGVGDSFQEKTKHHRNRPAPPQPAITVKPEPFKTYPDAPKIKLPAPSFSDGKPLWEILRSRRSRREFIDRALSLEELSILLWAAQGVSGRQNGFYLRTAPSAGALYPVETYILVNSVDGLEPGIYHYGVLNHEVELLKQGAPGKAAARAAMDQEMIEKAGAVFFWSAVFDRCKYKYGQRAYRYVYLDAGHIAQNLILAAEALGLGACPAAAYYDDEIDDILGIACPAGDGMNESVIYIAAVGNI